MITFSFFVKQEGDNDLGVARYVYLHFWFYLYFHCRPPQYLWLYVVLAFEYCEKVFRAF